MNWELLMILTYIGPGIEGTVKFDSITEGAVKRFQRYTGLDDDVQNPKGKVWNECREVAEGVYSGTIKSPFDSPVTNYYSPAAMPPDRAIPKWITQMREIKLDGVPNFVFLER